MENNFETDLKIHNEGTAPEPQRAILETAKQKLGFIPNMYGVMANSNTMLDAYVYSYEAFRKNSAFSLVEQEVVFLSISAVNECHYCAAAHTFIADKMSKVPREVTNAIIANEKIKDKKLKALSAFTKALVENRGWVSGGEKKDFTDAGFNSSQMLDILTAIGIKTMSNYMNHIKQTPIDDVFAKTKSMPV